RSRHASYLWGGFERGWAIEHGVAHHVGMPAVSLLRARTGLRGVTNIELFFDLVYGFAVTQLSHYLLDHATVEGVIQAAVLLDWCGPSGRPRPTSRTGSTQIACRGGGFCSPSWSSA